jgi:hypothetical protein
VREMTGVLFVRMEPSLLATIQTVAKLREQNCSQFARLAIREKLERIERETSNSTIERGGDDR